jgi:exosortase family protein XrtF
MIREYKEAIIFLVKYVAIYLALNTAYSYYVSHYLPEADPLTIIVTQHTEALLSILDPAVDYHIEPGSVNVPVTRAGDTVMMVYEGCNSVNVMIVFVAFIISFKGPVGLFLRYLVVGLLAVYAINLLRLMGLYAVALYFAASFYFFHKFFFTGVIYLVVFLIWYFWVADIKRWKVQPGTTNA